MDCNHKYPVACFGTMVQITKKYEIHLSHGTLTVPLMLPEYNCLVCGSTFVDEFQYNFEEVIYNCFVEKYGT